MKRHVRPITPGWRNAPRAVANKLDCPHDTDSDGCEREIGDNNTGCGSYSDAMVCIEGNTDVTCNGEKFRGCHYGQSDVDPDDDNCCAGYMDGIPNDNIDHGNCTSGNDAGWGETCYFSDDPPPGGGCSWWNDEPGEAQ